MAGMEVLGCRLISPIGSGAAGTVFRARQLRLERDVAVKLVPEGDAGVDTAERFRREVRAIAALDHPHVVPVHDAGESGGLLVLVMKLIDGVDLRTLVAERGPVEPEAAAAIIAQVADALDAAHAAGLVHRDVKPANVLLSRGGDRRAYLADFGLARTQLAEDTVTAESHWVGTPAYASPEQRAGGIVGPPADRYSLSATLAFLITGTPPGGELDREAMAPAVRAVLEVADRGMASSPDARFASCADLAAAAAAAAGSDEATAVLPRPSPPSSPPGDRVEARDGSRSVAGGGQSGLRAALIAAIALVALGLAAAVYGLVRPDPDAGGGPPAATASPSASASATASPSTAETTEGSGAATRYPELRPGDSGPTVTAAQLLLRDLGQQIEVTGAYDAQTTAVVRQLTRATQGEARDAIGDTTWPRLLSTQARGRTGPAVRAVQVLLRAAGQQLAVDGRYGAQTEDAVRAFQRSQSDRFLTPDGVVGSQTWTALLDEAG